LSLVEIFRWAAVGREVEGTHRVERGRKAAKAMLVSFYIVDA
jgi:hypothetical protein